MTHTTGTRNVRTLIVIEIAFFCIGMLYVFSTPLWTPPDEERHFAYIEYMAQGIRVPGFEPTLEDDTVYMAFHPPLYYLIGSLLCAEDEQPLEEVIRVNPDPGPVTLLHPQEELQAISGKARSAYILRIYSLLIGCCTVLFLFRLTGLFFQQRPVLQATATLFVAMNPEFMHIASSISNENLSTMLATATVYYLLRYLRDSATTSCAVTIGVLLGCAILTKTSNLFFVPLTIGFFGYVLIRGPERNVSHAVVALGLAAAIGAWWYMRNWLVYDDLVFSKTMALAHPWALRRVPLSLPDVWLIIKKTYISYFGYFGGLKVPLSWPFLACYGIVLVTGVTGLVRMLPRLPARRDIPDLLFVLCAFLGGLLIFVLFNVKFLGAYQGRYLFVVIAPTALLLFIGVEYLLPACTGDKILKIISVILIVLNVCALLFVLRPGYALPRIAVSLQQDEFGMTTPEISRNSSIGQSFTAPADRLCGVEVVFSNKKKKASGVLVFELLDERDSSVVRAIDFQADTVEDFSVFYFSFPPIPYSRGQRYLFRISSDTLATGSELGLWFSPKDVYREGTLQVNGAAKPGDAYFKLYVFTGDEPASDLEGLREGAHKQGLYLDLWELQLYHERTKQFREQTATHVKLQQVEEAHKTRWYKNKSQNGG